jgi:hypothetical protein
VNLVWNVSNEVIRENWRRSRKYTTKADLNVITRGASKEMLLNCQDNLGNKNKKSNLGSKTLGEKLDHMDILEEGAADSGPSL